MDINYLPAPVQQAYEEDPRTQMARLLIQQGTQGGPVRTPLAGIGSLFQQYAGMHNQNQLRQEYGQKADQYRQGQSALVKALMGDQADPQMQQIMATIHGNPMMSDQALPLAMSSYSAQQTARIKEAERLKELGQKITDVDAGNEIIRYNGLGQEVGRMPKGVAPGTEATLDQQRAAAAEAARHNSATEATAAVTASGQNKNLTESEGKAVTYGQRAVDANKKLTALEQSGYSAANSRDRIAAHVPFVSNAATSQTGQQYQQAKMQFIQAILRRDSGATITPQEIATTEATYFPQFGDGPQIKAQKSAAREEAISALTAGAGRGGALIGNTPSVGGQPVITPGMPTGVVDWHSLKK